MVTPDTIRCAGGRTPHSRVHIAPPVLEGAEPSRDFTSATDPVFISRLLEHVRESVTVEAVGGVRVEFRATAKLASHPVAPLRHIRLVDAVQSNSTVLVDNSYAVKIYRKLQGGLHPEIEVGRFLTDVAGCGSTPQLLGSVELVEGGRRTALAVVHAFVANQGDAWAMTTSYLDRFVEDQMLFGEGDRQFSYLRYMEKAGRRIAEMHMALASRDDLADFKPEPWEWEDARVWIDETLARAERSLEKLQQRRGAAKGLDRALIDRLLAVRGELRERLVTLLPESVDAVKIRHHGDLHLGQMLVVEDDAFIVDFEGEPLKGMAERRRKVPGVRDIAGLVRSIDYSTTLALERALGIAPERICGPLAAALDIWRERATAALVGAYRDTVVGTSLWPTDSKAADQMLQFFVLEKALYEIEYDLAHRPEWLRVPLLGVLRIVSQTSNKLDLNMMNPSRTRWQLHRCNSFNHVMI